MLYNAKSTKKLEKKLLFLDETELSLMLKAGTAIIEHLKHQEIDNLLVFIGNYLNSLVLYISEIYAIRF